MHLKIITMLESIKHGTYKGYKDYLGIEEIDLLKTWYCTYSALQTADFNRIVSLAYELYSREDIDFRPIEDYNEIVSALSQEYQFTFDSFLSMYSSFRKMLYL